MDTSGGTGGLPGGNDGGAGRFILGDNTIDPATYTLTNLNGAAVGTRLEAFSGSTSPNPFLPGSPAAPNLVEVAGGAEAFGLLEVDTQTLFSQALLSTDAATRSKAMLVRADKGPTDLGHDYFGYDWLLFANLTDQPLANPLLGAGGVLTSLVVGGWENDPQYGGNGDDVLSVLGAHQIYATLVPEGTTSVEFAADIGGTRTVGRADLADGQVLYLTDRLAASPVDQRFAPDGPTLGGRPWQRLTTLQTDTGTLCVELTGSADGNLAADAVRLVRPVLPNLQVVDLRGNPLDAAAHDYILPGLLSDRPSEDAAAPTRRFQDETFVNADWEHEKVHDDTPGGSITFTVNQALDDGLPGAYQQGRVTFTAELGAANIAHTFTGLGRYDPAVDGPVSNIDYSYWFKVFAREPENGTPDMVTTFMVRQANAQGGYDYYGIQPPQILVHKNDGWVQVGGQGITPADFGWHVGAGGYVDFGRPMEFGYLTVDGTSGPTTFTWGVDQFHVNVYSGTSAIGHYAPISDNHRTPLVEGILHDPVEPEGGMAGSGESVESVTAEDVVTRTGERYQGYAEQRREQDSAAAGVTTFDAATATAGQAMELFAVSSALFVANEGQWPDPSVRYIHFGQGANILQTDNGPVFVFFQREESPESEPSDGEPLPDDPCSRDNASVQQTVSVTFDGANHVTPVGVDQAETVYNFYVGDQSHWRSAVPTYELVAYPELYEGIDLVTWGLRDHLKYEFHVAPGADWQQIRVSYEGIESLSIDIEGRLHIATPLGDLIDDAPYVYQSVDGRQIAVAAEYAILDEDSYGFTITAPYDATSQLILDPSLSWSTYLGASGDDRGYNQTPSSINLSGLSIAEPMPAGTVVGTLSTVDVDLPLDFHTYQLVAGPGDTDNNLFAILPGTNQLVTNAVFDVQSRQFCEIRIRSTDLNGLAIDVPFVISVTDSEREIFGSKWEDCNGDGIWDADELAAEGWTIFLDENGDGSWTPGQGGEPGEPVTVTDAEGRYYFGPLPAPEAVHAHWALDEQTGNYACSAVGNNTGTVFGATWRPTGGRIGGALEFDGSDDYVEIDPESLAPRGSDWSISLWFWADATTTDQWLYVDEGADPNLDAVIVGLRGPVVETAFRSRTASPGSDRESILDGRTTIVPGQWYHLVVVRDGPLVTQYLNGKVDGVDTADGLGDIECYDGPDPRIGGRVHRFFDGMIDDVQIFHYALDQRHVLLADHVWRVTEEPRDSWRTANDPVVLPGGSLQFDGVDDFVTVPDDNQLDLTSQMTIEAWVRPSGNGYLVSKGNSFSSSGNYNLRTSGYSLVFTYWDGAGSDHVYEADTALAREQWQHVAVTYDFATHEIKMYVNGELRLGTWYDGNVPVNPTPVTTSNVLSFGAGIVAVPAHGYDIGDPIAAFAGGIDEIRLWSIARLQQDIVRDMHDRLAGNETGLVGYWPVDEGDGKTVFDVTGNANHGVLGAAGKRVEIAGLPAALSAQVDFGSFRVVDAGRERPVVEGLPVTVDAVVTDPAAANGQRFEWTAWTMKDATGTVIDGSSLPSPLTLSNRGDGVYQTTVSLGFTLPDDGLYTLFVTVTDLDTGHKYDDEVALRAKPAGLALDLPPAAPVAEGRLYTLSGSFVDSGSDAWEVRVDYGDGTIATIDPAAITADPSDPNRRLFSHTHRFLDERTDPYQVTVTIRDLQDLSSETATVQVAVTAAVPLVDSIANFNVPEGQPWNRQIAFYDGNDSWTATVDYDDGRGPQPATVTPDANTPGKSLVAIGPKSYGDEGEHTITVSVKDKTDGDVEMTFTVTSTNVPPSVELAGIPAGEVPEGTEITLTALVTDPLDPQPTYAWRVTKNGMDFDPQTPTDQSTFGFTPDDDGNYVVTVSITDDHDSSEKSTTVVVGNVAPVVTITGAAAESPEGQEIVLGSIVTDKGTADTGFVYAWSVTKHGQPYPTGTPTDGTTFRFTPDDEDQYEVRLEVHDDDGGVGIKTQIIEAVNLRPQELTILVDQPAPKEGDWLHFTGSFADYIGDSHQYRWEVVTNNGQAIPTETGAVSTPGQVPAMQFQALNQGKYWVRLTVSDDRDSTTVVREVTVGNRAPHDLAASGLNGVLEGYSIELRGSFQDEGEDQWRGTVEITREGSASKTVLPLSIQPDKTFSTTYVFGQGGTYLVKYYVTDDESGSAASQTKQVSVVITEVADTPTVTGASTHEDTWTTSGLVITPNVADGPEVTHFKITAITGGSLYQHDGATLIPEGTFITVGQGAAGLRFHPAADRVVAASFLVQASLGTTDDGLGGDPALATITLEAVNDAPTFTRGPDVAVSQGDGWYLADRWATNLRAGPADEAGQHLTFEVTGISDPDLFLVPPWVDAATGRLTFRPETQAVGSSTVTLELHDDGGTAHGGLDTSVQETFTIQVYDGPVVACVTPNLATIADANAGTAAFWLTVTFSRDMDPSVRPTITFPLENPNTTLTFNASQSGWSDSKTYVAKYNVADADTTLLGVDVRVAGAKGTSGKTHLEANLADKFHIDTQGPAVLLSFVNPSTVHTPSVTITASDAGSGIAEGCLASVDVDLNHDGDYADAGETGYATTTLSNGTATFNLNPALDNGIYTIRARVRDAVGSEGVSASQTLAVVSDIVVTNTNDSGPWSLRAAIEYANATSGVQMIRFNIPGGGVHTLQPLTPLPFTTDVVILDATTQPGYAGMPLVELDGSLAGAGADGLHLTAGNSTVRGLVINRFAGDGIELATHGNNVIEANYLGTDATGLLARANGYGVLISGVSGNTIGGTAAGAGNVISGNGGAGVYVVSGTRNAILSNRISGNGGLGIDLSPSGRTANDTADGDTGSNDLQNHPVITQAVVTGGTTTITGTLNSEANKIYRLEFFSNTVADPSGYGEGETYLESISVTTDASGNVSFTLPYSGDLMGKKITATATDPLGNTSEFAQAVPATSALMGLTSPNIAGAPASARPSSLLSESDAQAAIEAALRYWSGVVGSRLTGVEVVVADLPSGLLGTAADGRITLDLDGNQSAGSSARRPRTAGSSWPRITPVLWSHCPYLRRPAATTC